MDSKWNDILERQPDEGERVLVRLIGGAVRITSYSRFCYDHWSVLAWKKVPEQASEKR